MGCLGSRSDFKYEDEELLMTQLGLNLGYSNLDAFQIDRIFHRFSTNSKMTAAQFSKALSELKLPFEGFENLYKKFCIGSSYKMIHLCTTGIILTNSSIENKLKLIFQNYDFDVSGSLSIDEISEMIKDITIMACEYIPQFVASGNIKNEKLLEYTKGLIEVRKSITSQLIDTCMEDKRIISLEEFKGAFLHNDGLGELLNFSRLRIYCMKIHDKYIKKIECAIKALECNENFEEFQSFSHSPKKRRVSKTVQTLPY